VSSSDTVLHVVIPARYSSTRLPGKPLIDLAGTPMIVRVHDAASAALPAADVVVAVDDARIEDVLRAHDVPVVMTSPDWESGTDRVAEVARTRGWGADDLIINVQGDEPLLPTDLLAAFAAFCIESHVGMATASVPVGELAELTDPNVVKLVTRQDGTAMTFSRAAVPYDRDREPADWDLGAYRRHLGLYAYRNSVLQRLTAEAPCELERLERLEQLRALWLGISIHVMDWAVPPPGGVDTPDDLARVRAWLERDAA
jgi:3-deoxy-manno-octulosonate cytidylyltransferase (CMP-KDO synthetase)